jgi:hypothetical protein
MTKEEQWQQLDLWAGVAARVLFLAGVNHDLLLPIYRSVMRESGECKRTNEELARLAGGISIKTIERRLRHYADAGVILSTSGTTISRKTGKTIKWRVITLGIPADASRDEMACAWLEVDQYPDHGGRVVAGEHPDHGGGALSEISDHGGGVFEDKDTDHRGRTDLQVPDHSGPEITDHGGRYTPQSSPTFAVEGKLRPPIAPGFDDVTSSGGRPSGRPAIEDNPLTSPEHRSAEEAEGDTRAAAVGGAINAYAAASRGE